MQSDMEFYKYFSDSGILKKIRKLIPGSSLFCWKIGSESFVKIACLLFLLLGSPFLLQESFAQNSEKAKIQQIITRMPARDRDEFNELSGRLIEMGPEAWEMIISQLVPAGTGDDTYARYALNGLAKFVTQSGNESSRQSFEQAILDALQSGTVQPSDNVFLMAQLELAGSNASIDVLRPFLNDDRLCGPPARALTSIGTPEAFHAVLKAIPDAEPSRQATLIKTIGDAQIQDIVDEVKPYAQSNNDDIREAALYALAQSGNPAVASVFEDIDFQPDSFPTIQNTSLRLLYAQRLLDEGHSDTGRSLCKEILENDAPVHVKNNALSLLVDQDGIDAMDEVVRASTSDSPQLRESALEMAASLGDAKATSRWGSLLEKKPPEVQADIITMLGRRGDKKALPSLKNALKNKDLKVRLAAVDALTKLGGASAISNLVNALTNTDNASEINGIKTALLRLPTDQMTKSVATNLNKGSIPARVAMLQILGERRASSQGKDVFDQIRSDEKPVRMAALKALNQVATVDDFSRMLDLLTQLDAADEQKLLQEAVGMIAVKSSDPEKSAAVVLSNIDRTSGTQKAQLLKVLPHLPNDKTLKKLVDNTQNSDNEVKAAAVSALADWPYAPAIEPLLQFFQRSEDSELRQTALNGYLRLVKNLKFSSEEKVDYFARALDAAQNVSEKRVILSALATVNTSSAIKRAAEYSNSADVQDQALQTIAHILATQTDRQNPLNSADVAAALSESVNGEAVHKKLKTYIADERQKMEEARSFTSLFNGKNLSGWEGATDAYEVNDGMIEVKPNTHGNLFTEQKYRDFVFRFEFKLTPGANNGLGIRAPLEGDAAYQGMELQIIDNTAKKYADLHRYQFHGSIYGVVPAKRGYLKPVGDWNKEEVTARDSHITVKLNGEKIVDADLDTVSAIDGRDHPGLHRQNGHIGFLGHGDKVYFRNIRIKDLNTYAPSYAASGSAGRKMNEPPEGFKALFNGQNLEGWKGLVGNPETRAKMSDEELAQKQMKADSVMRKHWSVRNGILYYDGKGASLTTAKDYGDFEMLVDWKIEPHSDSGIYLRGSPQVQIWDPTEWPQGSGGLYNNKKHSSNPMVSADNSVGEWNHFRIRMMNDRVTVHLNGQLVVSNVVMENYWNRDKPIYSTGQIELQQHNTPLYFKNIFIREFPRPQKLFNGKDLTGWQRVRGESQMQSGWTVKDGVLSTKGTGKEWDQGIGSWLSTTKQYDNFKLELEYRMPEGGNSGIFLRSPQHGDPAFTGIEIQLLDDYAKMYSDWNPWSYTGSILGVKAPDKRVTKKAGEWQKMTIICDGPNIQVTLNGDMIINTSLVDYMDRVNEHPGLKRRKGYIGLQNHTSIDFRNINITEIK